MLDQLLADPLRLFIALSISREVGDEIEKAQAELRRALAQSVVRWTRREQFHLTLRFLGDVAAEAGAALKADLQAALQGFGVFPLRAEGIGVFPDLRRPRVIWAGVSSVQEQLTAIHEVVERVARQFTAEAGEDKFTGHVTLGRIKSVQREEAKRLAGLCAAMNDRCFGEWTTDIVQIMRSELSQEGAVHTRYATIPLGVLAG